MVTIGIGLVLAVLGIGFFVGTSGDHYHVTALIPAFFGIPLLVLGLLARQDKYLKHAMHAAAALGLIGFLGGFIMALSGFISSDNGVRPATIEQGLLALVCAVFVALCVRSFIVARRNRARAQKG
jgi:hypothetical protein